LVSVMISSFLFTVFFILPGEKLLRLSFQRIRFEWESHQQ
jgi:hypothetical protein